MMTPEDINFLEVCALTIAVEGAVILVMLLTLLIIASEMGKKQ